MNTYYFSKQVKKEDFRFKAFALAQQDTVFKLGTDAILLGSLCKVCSGRALDIGCGTGILSLMVAQRMPGLHSIDAIDINTDAVDLANRNFKSSPWRGICKGFEADIATFDNEGKSYELIITNPPFYQNSLLAATEVNAQSKHSDTAKFQMLIGKTASLLAPQGTLSLIIPFEHKQELKDFAKTVGLFIQRIVDIQPRPQKPYNRSIVELGFEQMDMTNKSLSVRNVQGQHYSADFASLTEPFYLTPFQA